MVVAPTDPMEQNAAAPLCRTPPSPPTCQGYTCLHLLWIKTPSIYCLVQAICQPTRIRSSGRCNCRPLTVRVRRRILCGCGSSSVVVPVPVLGSMGSRPGTDCDCEVGCPYNPRFGASTCGPSHIEAVACRNHIEVTLDDGTTLRT